MNTDETQTEVVADTTSTETTEQTTEVTETVEQTADPLDAITDLGEAIKAAKANRAIAQRYKKQPPKVVTKTVETQREQFKPSDVLRSPEFLLHADGYTADEIDLIMRNGGRAILKDEKNPLVMGIKVSREQRVAERAASQATDSSGMSALERKYTKADLEKMKPEELEKVIGFAQQ